MTTVVVPVDGVEIDEQAFIAYCRGRLAGFETPKEVVVAELPQTVGGKVLKYRLRERLSGVDA